MSTFLPALDDIEVLNSKRSSHKEYSLAAIFLFQDFYDAVDIDASLDGEPRRIVREETDNRAFGHFVRELHNVAKFTVEFSAIEWMEIFFSRISTQVIFACSGGVKKFSDNISYIYNRIDFTSLAVELCDNREDFIRFIAGANNMQLRCLYFKESEFPEFFTWRDKEDISSSLATATTLGCAHDYVVSTMRTSENIMLTPVDLWFDINFPNIGNAPFSLKEKYAHHSKLLTCMRKIS